MYSLLNREEKQKLKIIKTHKDQLIFREDEECEYAGIVVSGQISIRSYNLNGKEVIYNTIDSGGIFGNNLLFSSDRKYKGDVISLKDSTVAIVDKETLLQILKENEDFLEYYLKIQADSLKQINLKVKLLSFDSARERFMYYLNYHQGLIHFESVSALANELSLSRENVSRLLSSLVKEGIIIKEKQLVKLID